MLGFGKVKREDAARILADVAPEKCFWVNNGPIIHNIYEFATVLITMNPETFRHHVSTKKNDFRNWASDVLMDTKLARQLGTAQSQKAAAACVKKRIKEMEKAIEEP